MRTDLELLEAWRGGDTVAGSELFDRYSEQVGRFFRNKLAAPEDAIQATFLACVEARDRFEGRSSFRTYVFAVARNQLHGHLRRLARKPVDVSVDSIAVITDAASGKMAIAQDRDGVRQALRELPVEQQVLLELHYWESLDIGQLSEVFGLTRGATRVRLHRARKGLASHLRDETDPEALAEADARAVTSRPR